MAKLRDLWKKQRKGKVWREKVVWSALIGGCGLLCRWQEVVERVGGSSGGETVGERVVLVLQFHVRKKE